MSTGELKKVGGYEHQREMSSKPTAVSWTESTSAQQSVVFICAVTCNN